MQTILHQGRPPECEQWLVLPDSFVDTYRELGYEVRALVLREDAERGGWAGREGCGAEGKGRMSPLEITAILWLHVSAAPLQNMPYQVAHSQTMREAFERFERDGLLVEGVNFEAVDKNLAPYPRLSSKGKALVERLCEVQS